MKFAKMHGAGNDFLVVESSGEERDWPAHLHRHVRAPPRRRRGRPDAGPAVRTRRLPHAPLQRRRLRGRGQRQRRPLPREVRRRARHRPGRRTTSVSIEAIHDILVADVFLEGGKVVRSRLSMGQPKFKPAEIPVLADVTPPVIDFPIDVDGQRIPVSCMSIGNPHAVNFLDSSVHDYPLEAIGPKVEHHAGVPGARQLRHRQRRLPRAHGRPRLGARRRRDAGLRQRLLRGDGDGAPEGPGRGQSRHNATRRPADGRVGRRAATST